MIVRDATSAVVYDTGTTYKALGATSDELTGYNVGDEWVDFSDYTDGSYTSECHIKYDN